MAKKELLEIVESFIQSHQDDNLLLKSAKQSIDDLFNEYITPDTPQKFEDIPLEKLIMMKDRIQKGINNPIIQQLKGVKDKLIDKLEKINVRIEDLS
jgi:hypothetical protein